MKDQAEKLRKLMKDSFNNSPKIKSQKVKILSIIGGKKGIGKTSFAVNLAIALQNQGYKVIVLDTNMEINNITWSSGIVPQYTILDILGNGKNKLSLADNKTLEYLMFRINKLENNVDFIIVDTDVKLSNEDLKIVMSSDEIVLVTTPDTVSITNGYAMIKVLIINEYKGKLNVFVNMVKDKDEARKIYNKLKLVSNKFLKIGLKFLGYLNKNQIPFIINRNSQVSKIINNIALNIVDCKDENKI